MSQITIRAAFEKRLNDWAKAQAPPIKIAFENVAFTPPAELYLRTFLLPGEGSLTSLENDSTAEIGLFQVSVFAPIDKGARPAETMAEALQGLFPSGAWVGPARITREPSIAPAQTDNGRYHVPVTIRYSTI